VKALSLGQLPLDLNAPPFDDALDRLIEKTLQQPHENQKVDDFENERGPLNPHQTSDTW